MTDRMTKKQTVPIA